jgi:chorismate-pyruvate lyase
MFDVHDLMSVFYEDPATLAQLTEVEREDLPSEFQRLLVHQEHMTVAIEAFHESLVEVDVLERQKTETHYARKILLRRQSDNAVVQFGIMRVAVDCLSDDIRNEIEQEQRPLGRILVRHNVLRTVRLYRLWSVTPGDDLCRLFNLSDSRRTYGRTAGIDLNGQPAIEVLEIPTPL